MHAGVALLAFVVPVPTATIEFVRYKHVTMEDSEASLERMGIAEWNGLGNQKISGSNELLPTHADWFNDMAQRLLRLETSAGITTPLQEMEIDAAR